MGRKQVRKTYKRIEYGFVSASLAALFLCMLFTKGFTTFKHTGNNIFHIYVNDQYVGTLDTDRTAEHLLIEARRAVASQKDTLLFMEGEVSIVGEEVIYADLDDEETVMLNMEKVLEGTLSENIQKSCTIKIEEYMVSLNNLEEARQLLQAAIDLYDDTDSYVVELEKADNREFSVITPKIVNINDDAETEEANATEGSDNNILPESGAGEYLSTFGLQTVEEEKELAPEDYATGVMSMNFLEDVEISEGYLPKSQVTSLEDAIEYVTKEQETPGEYEVKSGDTLSAISLEVNIPMETLVSLNSDKLESVNSTIRVGDILTITVPEPELSVERTEREYVEEVYDAEVIYQYNDDWYTTQSVILQQPSSGFRKAVVDTHYVNNSVESRETVCEEILMEAVPKIVEVGTKIPPTYIKPISGGKISSYFGKRKSPGGIGSTYHKGIDWAVPTGTPVYASCGGTVTYAGWASGYGYLVTIKHPDGRQTRYAHNSRIACYVGQSVSQGTVIAYSGSTGNSTGPHVHFEILINGVQVNPLDYLN